MLVAHYLKNGWKYRLGYNGTPIGNGTWDIKWSRADITWPMKGQDHDQIYLDANILKTVRDNGSVPMYHPQKIAYGESSDRWHQVKLKGQDHDPNIFGPNYGKMASDTDSFTIQHQ